MRLVEHRAVDRGVVSSQLALPVDVEDDREVRLYRIRLPFLPPSKNVYDRWHWQQQRSVKGKWRRHIETKVNEMDVPLGVPRIGLAATLIFPNRNRRDLQNYSQALWHFVPDALVRAGVIVDDTPEHVEYPPNLGVRFSYDLRKGIPKERRAHTIIALTMEVPNA